MTKIFVSLKVLLLFWCFILLSSCGINSNLMFKEPKGYKASTDSIPLHPTEAYRISVDDKLSFSLAVNDGKKIVESLSGVGGGTPGGNQGQEYIVRNNGMAEFPIIGEVNVVGLTIAACEDTLETLFSKQYQDPFVQVRITNQRVIVFPGNGGDAKVIPLMNNNTTLMEAIAQAGGITERGKARSVKVIRREGTQRKVYNLDLSTIDGLQYADMIVQGNDYIYIEPNPELTKGVVRELAPVVSIFSSALIIFTFLTQ